MDRTAFQGGHRLWVYHLAVFLVTLSLTFGCAAPEDEPDADHDGIINAHDYCPVTPSGAAVDEDGCDVSRLDTDGDGIVDDADYCADTPSDQEADETGCAASQIASEVQVDVLFQDAGLSDETSFDVVQTQCTEDATGDSPLWETFTDVFAQITLTVPVTLPGLTLNGYSIEYIPQLSEDGSQNMVLPPALSGLTDYGSVSIHFPASAVSTFTITCFTVDQKAEYRNLIESESTFSELLIAGYTIKITLQCTDDKGNENNLEISRKVYLGDYDNCAP